MVDADFHDKHPQWDAGTPGGVGGQFRPKAGVPGHGWAEALDAQLTSGAVTAPVRGADRLKLAGRIDLADGEELLGSSKVVGDDGTVRLALTRRNGEPSLRIGIGGADFGGREDEAGPWRGDPGRVAAINAERKALRDERDRLGEEWDYLTESGADPARLAVVEKRLDELEDTSTVDVDASGFTARLDGPQVAALSTSIASAVETADRRSAELWAFGDPIDARRDQMEAEIERLRQQIDDMTPQRDPLVEKYRASLEGGPPISREDDAELDRLTEIWDGYYRQIGVLRDQIEALNAEYQDLPDVDEKLAEGVIPGSEWGDVHYEIWGSDNTDNRWNLTLAVRPHGSDAWESMSDSVLEHQRADLDIAETRKVLRQLAEMSPDWASRLGRQMSGGGASNG